MIINMRSKYDLYLTNTKDNRHGAGPYTLLMPDHPSFRGTPRQIMDEIAEFRRISGGCFIDTKIVGSDGREYSRQDLETAISIANMPEAK